MKIRLCLFTFLLIFACSLPTFACVWRFEYPICASWTEADAVFLGKVMKVESAEKSDDLPAGARKVRFQVAEKFKGADNQTFALYQAEWTTSCDPAFKKDETWIVFARHDPVGKSFKAFRGVKIEPKTTSNELETLRRIVAGKTATTIAGQIDLPPDSRDLLREPVEITVKGSGANINAQTNADGAFSIPLPSDGVYKVELKFPFRAAVKGNEFLLGASNTEGVPTIFRYEARLNDGDCNYNVFEVLKVSP